jgi:hypothetical protein
MKIITEYKPNMSARKSTSEQFRFRLSELHVVKDIDLDRDGVNDFIEHGKEWVKEKLQEMLCQTCPNRLG